MQHARKGENMISTVSSAIAENVKRVIVGKDEVIEQVLIALLCEYLTLPRFPAPDDIFMIYPLCCFIITLKTDRVQSIIPRRLTFMVRSHTSV